jgi:hypothetical protein
MRSRVVFLVAAVMAAVMLAASPAAVRANPVKVVGGGLARFDYVDPKFRLSSYFGVFATIQDDGTTAGQFTCVITDFVVVLGNLDRATMNGDGSIKLEGTAIAMLMDGTLFEEIPYAVTVWEGGPKVGRFLYKDPALPDPGDYETTLFGGIQIRR